MTRVPLEQISVPEPCPASWSKMRGSRAARFCGHCQKHVYDLSAMPRDMAERLVCESGGELCVRFARAENGDVMTLNYQMNPSAGRWSWRVWTLLALAVAMVTGVVNAALFGDRVFRPRTTFVAGAIAPISAPAPGGGGGVNCPTNGGAGGQ